MATAAVQHAPGNTLDQPIEPPAESTKPAKHHVYTQMNYHKVPADGSLPRPVYVGEKNPEKPRTPRMVTVHDVSGEIDDFSLDEQGFQYVNHVSKDKDFLDEEKMKAEYFPEIEQLLKDTTGATRVYIWHHAIRRLAVDRGDGTNANVYGPGKSVHIDQSYECAENTVRYELPDEAEELLKKRFQIINVWRPIKTIRRDPFAVADARSVPDSDLVPAARIHPDHKDETWTVKPNPDHRWYFKYAQEPNEVLMFKCFDSVNDGRAKRSPHSAFTDPAHDQEPPRESVEVRTLVFFDEDR